MTSQEQSLRELNPIDGFLLEMLGDYHRHLCPTCDGAENGCLNCRHTGYNQTPCNICDKDGIAFKNRREFLDKVKALIQESNRQAEVRGVRSAAKIIKGQKEYHLLLAYAADLEALKDHQGGKK